MRVGVDLVSVSRIIRAVARYGDRFLDRIFTPEEKLLCFGDACRLAGRFAAKEAVAKALGTGLWRSGVVFHDIEILRGQSGEPIVALHGGARKHFESIGGIACHVSISHEKEMACAFCVIETVSQNCERDSEDAATSHLGMLACDPMSIQDHMSVVSEDTLDVADSIRVDEI